MEAPSLVALEFIVSSLDQPLEFLVDLLGLELVDRYKHQHYDAEVAVLQSGAVAFSLLCPTDEGDRSPLPYPQPRISQMTFTAADEAGLEELRGRLVEAGGAVVHVSPKMFYLDRQMIQAVFGQAPAMVFTVDATVDDPDATPS